MSDSDSEYLNDVYLALIDASERLELREQADLVIQGFDSLGTRHAFDWPNTPADLSLDRLRSKKDLLTQLHSNLLPRLRDQLSSLSKALNRSELRKDTVKKFALILEIQPQVSLTLEQIIRTARDIIPGRVPKSLHRSDQHFKDFKCFRLHGLVDLIRDSFKTHFGNVCQTHRGNIEELISSTERYATLGEFYHDPLYSWTTHFYDDPLCQTIANTTLLLKESELDIICAYWPNAIEKMVYGVKFILRLADPRPIDDIDRQGPSIASVQLSKPFIPIFKLLKLFFVKLFRQVRNIHQASSFTEMSSDQFTLLQCSAAHIGRSMTHLYCHLSQADIHDRPNTSRNLIEEIEKIIPLFTSYEAVLMLYIVPFFPDTNGLSPQVYFGDWFVSWNTLFSVATYNAIQAAVHFFEQDGP
ncbi:hypothetical protein MJO28_009976 [Puccinia striiformis f. sp. tritici]|uniref:Uncharacterized protein n=1 Tax=Puccinia striiformis f. sp. tritici TaxID=168172 RepID=A0ACC0E914_9BASI|nr:hypothetical protein MJO28_009976 [Puccinia striiformis f. sp. tritici]KAI9630410.1 hypothetical protein KEM48_013905 [Puccinia striiformis f. sp. tritici PST-130]